MSAADQDFNCDPLGVTAYTVTQGKRIKKNYGQGRSVIHANVAEALKMRQVRKHNCSK